MVDIPMDIILSIQPKLVKILNLNWRSNICCFWKKTLQNTGLDDFQWFKNWAWYFLKRWTQGKIKFLLPFAGCLKISKLRNISWNRRWKATGYMYQELYQPIIACVYLLRSKTTLIRPTGMYGDVGTGSHHFFAN